jgi:hypothetical protein
MTGLRDRMRKLEEATGWQRPCAVCDAISAWSERVAALRTTPPRGAPVFYDSTCAWCLRVVRCDLADYTPAEQKLYRRWLALLDAGQLCAPETESLWAQLESAFDGHGRELYGPGYGALAAELERALARACAEMVTPLRPPVCRVPNCTCAAKGWKVERDGH